MWTGLNTPRETSVGEFRVDSNEADSSIGEFPQTVEYKLCKEYLAQFI
jgi:hypothetical protein